MGVFVIGFGAEEVGFSGFVITWKVRVFWCDEFRGKLCVGFGNEPLGAILRFQHEVSVAFPLNKDAEGMRNIRNSVCPHVEEVENMCFCFLYRLRTIKWGSRILTC